MLLKWVTCSVSEETREAFGSAQRGWSAIAGQPGLLGQVGGWDTTTDDAHVLGLWADNQSYEAFMQRRHDVVAEQTGQASTYQAIETATGSPIFTIPGDSSTLAEAIAGGVVLRIADCEVTDGRRDHFVQVQREVWAPGMAAAGGMLGGVFTQLGPDRYLVTTWWSDVAAHERYVSENVIRLREQAGADDDITSLSGHVLVLEPRWKVLGRRRGRPRSTGRDATPSRPGWSG